MSTGDGIGAPSGAGAAEALVIGESFTIDSKIMGEVRRMNVFVPTVYGEKIDGALPVLYMPDGGMHEDFLHIAGLVQVLVCNGGMRPFIVVGIENTHRRRDLSGPTSNAEDRKMAPVVGGSATFRRFIKEELMPAVRGRYRTTDEAAIVGESLAGLFVVETFLLEPDLFSTYIAVDPSLWWDSDGLVKEAEARAAAAPATSPPLPAATGRKAIVLASSGEPMTFKLVERLAGALPKVPSAGAFCVYAVPLEKESHATVYHPAALLAFRAALAPPPSAEPAR